MRRFLALPSTYPVTGAWAAGVVALMALSAGWISLPYAIAGFGFACVLIILAVTHHQLTVVHSDVAAIHVLVNSQRSALVNRIDTLIAALTAAGVHIPADPEQAKVQQAMKGAKRDE